ncbi:MAG TPA: DegV family protein [Acidimicrobiia bacterium]|jgi:DegV family protein with EDD domain
MTVKIVTDSAAALPPDLVERYGITVVPMWLTLGGDQVRDDQLSIDDVLSFDHVSTSGPSPGEFADAITACMNDDGVVVLTIAATMSSTFGAAQTGADSVEGRSAVLDTSTAAGAQGLVVLAAARAAEAGGSLDDVERAAAKAIEEVRLVAMVSDLDHLVRSGRVPEIAGWAGRRLGIRPLFEFRDGKPHRLRPAFSVDAAKDRMVALLRRSRVPGARLHVAALHAQAHDEARELLGRVEAEQSPETSFVGRFGTVMVAHTGPGLAGLAWWWET